MPGDEALAGEIAQLELLRGLAPGAAHTLNNALAAILAEVQLLAEERKGDPAVAECCASIEREIERCARLARALSERSARLHTAIASDAEVDLVVLARRVAPLLRDTVSRSIGIEWQLPGGAEMVRGERSDVERLLLLAAYGLARGAPAGAALQVAFEGAAHGPELRFSLSAPAASTVREAPWDRAVAEAVRWLAERSGVAMEATSGVVRLRFSRPPGDTR